MIGEFVMANGLYGIYHSNRTADDHWGKNCFNSSFPTATACYMLDTGIRAIYITLSAENDRLIVRPQEISLNEVFNCGDKNRRTYILALSLYMRHISNILLILSTV